MIYLNLYLKYKTKYLNLYLNQKGGIIEWYYTDEIGTRHIINSDKLNYLWNKYLIENKPLEDFININNKNIPITIDKNKIYIKIDSIPKTLKIYKKNVSFSNKNDIKTDDIIGQSNSSFISREIYTRKSGITILPKIVSLRINKNFKPTINLTDGQRNNISIILEENKQDNQYIIYNINKLWPICLFCMNIEFINLKNEQIITTKLFLDEIDEYYIENKNFIIYTKLFDDLGQIIFDYGN